MAHEGAQSEVARGARPRSAWWQKLLIALTSSLVLVLALELGARAVLPSLAPVLVRDGFYVNALPLVTGVAGLPLELAHLPTGQRLREEKAPGELRVFVYGESSVTGSPLGSEASMPAMLHDALRKEWPERSITVVNMGRSSSVATNVYYYLLYTRRFAPDYAVFFMGMNDARGLPGEQCAMVTSPGLHRAWRGLVDSSALMWLARVYGPQLLWSVSPGGDWHPQRDCPEPSFSAWTELLVREARAAGARVIVANPVKSAAQELEDEDREPGGDDDLPAMDETYRALMACALTEGCPYSARLLAAFRDEATSGRLRVHREDLSSRAQAWAAAVARAKEELPGFPAAQHIAFDELMRSHSPEGILAERYFADWLHLSPFGYMLLARAVEARLVSLERSLPERPVLAPRLEEVMPYVTRGLSTGMEVAFQQFRFGYFITAVPGLRFIAEHFPRQACATDERCLDELEQIDLALGWLRQQAGLEPALPAALRAKLADFKPLRHPLASPPR